MASNTTQPWPLPLGETIVDPPHDAPTTPPAHAESTTGEESVDDLLRSLRSPGVEARTDPIVDPAAPARRTDAVADALRGLREAQDRPWAPTPAAAAASDGARYAAHYGVHAIPRAATPEEPASKVILNVTLPPAEPRRPPSSPDHAEVAARHARTHVALPRVVATVVRPAAASTSNRSTAPSRMHVALMTLGIVLVFGGGIVWGGFSLWSPSAERAASSAVATPAAPPVVVAEPLPPPELTAAVAPRGTTNDDPLPGAAASPSAGTPAVGPPRRVAPRPSPGRAAAATPAAPAAPAITTTAAVAKPAPSPPRAPASPSRPVQETFE